MDVWIMINVGTDFLVWYYHRD